MNGYINIIISDYDNNTSNYNYNNPYNASNDVVAIVKLFQEK